MFSFFKKDPAKKLESEIATRYEQAVAYQRNGKLREYGETMKEIEGLEARLAELQAAG